MWSEDSASEGAMLMKSILMYSSRPVEFHIICDHDAETYLRGRLALVERPAHPLLVRFYRLTWEQMTARIAREGAITTDHSAGIPGLMKLFIHEILPPSVARAIFVDTDALFISDAAALWDVFGTLSPAAALAVPTHPDQSAPEWHDANRICSCIMLLDLARLRAVRLMDSELYRRAAPPPGPGSDADDEPDLTDPAALAAAYLPSAPPPRRALAPRAFRAMFGPPAGATGHYAGVKLGDQGYWWALVDHYRALAAHLPYDWEVSSCLMDMYLTGLGADAAREAAEAGRMVHTEGTPHDGEAVVPRMLHFNCLDGPARFFEWDGWADPENSLTKRWWPAVQYHVGFKWLWLNRRRDMPAGNVTIETVEDVKFADELFAIERGVLV
ncbi:hypothetical protein OBBRIDRAFT_720832 [Obba rivulosa]|uniref:Glycosyltransferase family 8 protein n=1 Tax=Obba rivulosa TaxID=1052685 RepID=A0A8E2DSY1_9APHY|nr:hypothetical protein OBBRIDRAFT_720832 [Obba rivulosa]